MEGLDKTTKTVRITEQWAETKLRVSKFGSRNRPKLPAVKVMVKSGKILNSFIYIQHVPNVPSCYDQLKLGIYGRSNA